VPARAQEIFALWKKARKALKKKKKIDDWEMKSSDEYLGNSLSRTAEILRTQPEHIVKTLKRFLKELEEMKSKL
jgi:hypothetical protein